LNQIGVFIRGLVLPVAKGSVRLLQAAHKMYFSLTW